MNKEEAILNTAITLFNKNGFHGTTTAQVAKEAGVANGTLFQYFKSKENLVLQAYLSIKEELHEYLLEHPNKPGDTLTTIKSLVKTSLGWALKHHEKFDFLQQFHSSPYYKTMDKESLAKYDLPHIQLIQKAMDEGVIQPNPVELIYAIVSSYTFGIYQYTRSKKLSKEERSRVIANGLDMLLKMLV